MSKKSKELISTTLLDLMGKYPFNEITISEICGNTSIVRKTFYNNFSSKEDVIAYIVEKLVVEYFEMVKEENSHTTKEMSYLYFRFGKKHKGIMSLLIENNLFYIFRNQFNELLPTLNPRVPGNLLTNLSEDDLKYVFAFNSAGVTHMLEIWIKTGFERTAREMSEIYFAISQGYLAN